MERKYLKDAGKLLKTPAVTDPIGDIVDWIEIRSLADPREAITAGLLMSWLDFVATASELAEATDLDFTPLDSIRFDERAEDVATAVFDEVARRVSACDGSYPFDFQRQGRFGSLRPIQSFRPGQLAYLFGLFATENALLRVVPAHFFDDRDRRLIPELLQIAGTVAASGLLYGESVSFGFPRKNKTRFRDALNNAVQKRIKEGEVRSGPFVGSPIHVKDAGIDVIAWRHFPDEMPGKLLLLGQCASGKTEWREKGVIEKIPALYSDYFTRPFSSIVISATFVPFSIAHSPDLVPGSSPRESITETYRHYTARLGLVIDRCRLAYLVPIGLKRHIALGDRVEQANRFMEIEAWVNYCVDYLRDAKFIRSSAA